MTICANFVFTDSLEGKLNPAQYVMLILNIPAYIIWMGGGEHDTHLITFRALIFMQWLLLGGFISVLHEEIPKMTGNLTGKDFKPSLRLTVSALLLPFVIIAVGIP